jgi:hypothetical protein
MNHSPEHTIEIADPRWHRQIEARDIEGLPVDGTPPEIAAQGFK